MGRELWAKVHGAAVHFPIALVLVSFGLDTAGRMFPALAGRRHLHAAGYWCLLSGASAAVPAAVSGLVMTKGVLLGHDSLRAHHLFAWPALALIAGVSTWRLLGPGSCDERPPLLYLGIVGAACVLVTAAGFWGGEMLLGR